MIVNVGDLMVDVFPPRRYVGGKAALYAAAQLLDGSSAAVVGAVGNDTDGATITSTLHELQIDVSGITVVDRPTGWDEVSGDSWSIERGANLAINHETIQSAPVQALFDRASIVLVNQGVAAVGAEAALSAARERGVFTMLALAPEAVEIERRIDPSYYSAADVLIVNRIEAAYLIEKAGLPLRASEESIAIELWRLTRPRRAFIYCQGVHGAVVVSSMADGTAQTTCTSGASHFNAATEHYIGAGDAMVGLIASALAKAQLLGGDAMGALGPGLDRLMARGVRVAAATTKWAGPLTCAQKDPNAYA